MNHFLKIFLPLILVLSMGITALADGSAIISAEHDCSTHGDVEVIFKSDTAFSTLERMHITEVLTTGDGGGASTYLIACWLLGHNYEYEEVVIIAHCERASQPRCLRAISRIGDCTRCNSTTTEVLSEEYIFCCP